MYSEERNILIICEGKDEITLFNTISRYFPIEFGFQFYCYETNIHIFGNYLFDNYLAKGFDMDDLDVIQVLKEYRDDHVLKNKYTDILLIFDFDPHDPRFNKGRLLLLQEMFSESTNQGQLFINYPMIESAIDFYMLPDESYNSKTCSKTDLYRGGYKNQVKQKSVIKKIENIDMDSLPMILKHTFEKLKYLVGLDNTKYLNLLKMQKQDKIYILNSSLLFLYEYSPKVFEDYVR